jgi:hypothetical protein
MKLRKLENNAKEYEWESGKARYAIIYIHDEGPGPSPVIATFDSLYWATKFVVAGGSNMRIMEIVDGD